MLEEILEAKEQRQAIRQEFAKDGYATISLNFNIPGYPKSDNYIRKAFLLVKDELHKYLIASRILVHDNHITIQHDKAGDICFFPIKQATYDLNLIKEDLEAFEEEHALGRLLDVDLFDTDQIPISSGKKKACFLCNDKPAIECMHEQRHSHEELRSHILNLITKYLERDRKVNVCRKLSELATQSILMEISLPGKPGLVCPENQGSHTDMDYLTFIHSTSAISIFFEEIAELGYHWNGIRNKQILREIRTIGLKMEQEMFRATHGVNTQKGIIFLMGFSLFAAAHVLKFYTKFDTSLFREVIKLLNKGIVSKELENGWNKNKSNGEKCFNKFGKDIAGGIRQEIELGFPIVFDVSLPYMQELFPNGLNIESQNKLQKKLLRVLIQIISVNNDTNVLYRSDIEVLNKLKGLAQCLKKTEGNLSENSFYKDLVNYCNTQNISPGGSADILAISIFIYQVINNF